MGPSRRARMTTSRAVRSAGLGAFPQTCGLHCHDRRGSPSGYGVVLRGGPRQVTGMTKRSQFSETEPRQRPDPKRKRNEANLAEVIWNLAVANGRGPGQSGARLRAGSVGLSTFRAACLSLRSRPSRTRENKTNPIPPYLLGINGLGSHAARFSRRPRCDERHHACRVASRRDGCPLTRAHRATDDTSRLTKHITRNTIGHCPRSPT